MEVSFSAVFGEVGVFVGLRSGFVYPPCLARLAFCFSVCGGFGFPAAFSASEAPPVLIPKKLTCGRRPNWGAAQWGPPEADPRRTNAKGARPARPIGASPGLIPAEPTPWSREANSIGGGGSDASAQKARPSGSARF